MDVSQASGQELLTQLITLTGLPQEFHSDLQEILLAKGTPIDRLTMDDVRAALMDYLVTLESEIPDSSGPESPVF